MAVSGNPRSPYEALAEGIDEVKELARVMVRGLMSEGFTEEQARDITAGIWRTAGRPTSEGKEEGS